MCFRPVKAVKKIEPTLVMVKLEAVAGPPKAFKVEVKNSGEAGGNLMPVAMFRESSQFSDSEIAIAWDKPVIAPNESAIGTINFEWISGKTYYIKAQTKENTSVTQYTKAA